jgi:hypothetical protein
MGIVDDIVHGFVRAVRKDAGKLWLPVLLAMAGGLAGTAGAAFLTAWAYLTLSMTVGHRPAALLIGLGLTLLAAGLLALAKARLSKKTPASPPVDQTEAPATGVADLASQIVFTAAFVLARSLGEGKRD